GRRDETEESEAKREHEGVEEQFTGVSAVGEGGYVEGRGFDASGYGDRDDLENSVRGWHQLESHIPEDDDAFRATASGEVEHVLSAAMSSEGDFDWRGDQIGRRDETEESEAKREHEGVEEQFTGVSAVREGGYVEGRGFDASGYGDRDDLENIVRESDQLQSHIPEDDDAFRATASGEVEHVLSAAMSSEGDFDWRGDQIGRRDETEESEAKREHEGFEEQFTGVSAVREGGYVEGRGFDASGYEDRDDLENIVRESDQLQSHIPEDDDAFRATASGEVEHVLSAAMSSEGDFDWRGDQIGRRDETDESEAKREHEGVEEQFTGVSAVRDRGSGDIFEPDLRSSARDDFSHVQLRDRDGSSSLLHGRFSSENAAVDRGSTVSSTFSFDIFRNSHFSSSGAESHPFALDSSCLIPPDTDSASAISPDFVGLLRPFDASGGEVAPALNGTHNTGNPLDVESSHLSKVVSADGSDDNYQKLSLFGLESSPGVVFTRDNIRSSVTGESHDVTSKSDISGSSKPLGSEEDVI
ncbi:hypothetical protein D915_003243, partial [Fasciola hepatica]